LRRQNFVALRKTGGSAENTFIRKANAARRCVLSILHKHEMRLS
jgi:hypothetical protein